RENLRSTCSSVRVYVSRNEVLRCTAIRPVSRLSRDRSLQDAPTKPCGDRFFAADVSVGEFPQRPERKADVVRMRRRGELEEGKRARPGAAADKLLFARAMRGAPTRGEAVLWAELRGRGLSGWRFRRQHVIAGYIVDFYCPRLWLAIEVDGSVHDAQRDDDE